MDSFVLPAILVVLWFFLGMISIQLGDILKTLERAHGKEPDDGKVPRFKDVWYGIVWVGVSFIGFSYLLGAVVNTVISSFKGT